MNVLSKKIVVICKIHSFNWSCYIDITSFFWHDTIHSLNFTASFRHFLLLLLLWTNKFSMARGHLWNWNVQKKKNQRDVLYHSGNQDCVHTANIKMPNTKMNHIAHSVYGNFGDIMRSIHITHTHLHACILLLRLSYCRCYWWHDLIWLMLTRHYGLFFFTADVMHGLHFTVYVLFYYKT